jgi:catechol 2,3-dioxygenase-like lactoylglutathione lyase family enzyme
VLPNNGFHVCFTASDKEAVHRFHTVDLAEGGRDTPDYYGAFVIDPDGHLGVVCRTSANR